MLNYPYTSYHYGATPQLQCVRFMPDIPKIDINHTDNIYDVMEFLLPAPSLAPTTSFTEATPTPPEDLSWLWDAMDPTPPSSPSTSVQSSPIEYHEAFSKAFSTDSSTDSDSNKEPVIKTKRKYVKRKNVTTVQEAPEMIKKIKAKKTMKELVTFEPSFIHKVSIGNHSIRWCTYKNRKIVNAADVIAAFGMLRSNTFRELTGAGVKNALRVGSSYYLIQADVQRWFNRKRISNDENPIKMFESLQEFFSCD